MGLIDIKNGKKVDWQKMKKQANQLAVIYKKIADDLKDNKDYSLVEKYYKKSENVAECNNTLLFGKQEGQNDLEKKLVYCNNCRDRGCPLCSHKKSRVRAYQLNEIFKRAKAENDNLDFIFVTLTLKNIPNDSEALHRTLLDMNKNFSKMCYYSRIIGKNGRSIAPEDRMIKGVVRSDEVTYNWKTDKFHPHIHAIFAVDKERYFRKENYISQNEWVSLWKRACDLDYDPVVFVEKLHKNKKKMNKLGSAILEISKYETKPSDFLQGGLDIEVTKRVVYSLSEGMKGIRSFSLTGILKKVKQSLFGDRDLNDVSDDEMLNVDGKSELDLNSCIFLQYKWSPELKDYVEVEVENDLICYIRDRYGGN